MRKRGDVRQQDIESLKSCNTKCFSRCAKQCHYIAQARTTASQKSASATQARSTMAMIRVFSMRLAALGASSARRGVVGVRAMSSLPEHIELSMPALSPTMEVGNIGEWFISEGGVVEEGAPIVAIETVRRCAGAICCWLTCLTSHAVVPQDKSTVSFDATEAGFLAKILVPEGSADIPVGQLLGIMVEDEADVAAFADYTAPEVAPKAAEQPAQQPEAAPEPAAPSSPEPTPKQQAAPKEVAKEAPAAPSKPAQPQPQAASTELPR